MSVKKIKKKFINRLELFYRNFGNEWEIEDFATVKKEQEIILNFLIELETKEIIKLNKDGRSFIIKDLPSNHHNLINE